MSAPTKPPGGRGAAATRLHIVWRDSLSEEQRDYWRALLISETTQAAIRAQLKARLNIEFKRDGQVTEFRHWVEDQDTRDLEEQRRQEDERRLTQEFGDQYSKDKIREQVIAAALNRSLARGDFELGLKTIREDRENSKLTLDEKRFQRETVQLLIKYHEDAQCREILTSADSTDAKTEQLGQRIFGEDWQ